MTEMLPYCKKQRRAECSLLMFPAIVLHTRKKPKRVQTHSSSESLEKSIQAIRHIWR